MFWCQHMEWTRTVYRHSLSMAVSSVQFCGTLVFLCPHMEWAAISTDGHIKSPLYTLSVYGGSQRKAIIQ